MTSAKSASSVDSLVKLRISWLQALGIDIMVDAYTGDDVHEFVFHIESATTLYLSHGDT